MSYGSIVIDSETAPGALTVDLIAAVGKQLATFGVNGKSSGTVQPDQANGRINVQSGGVYKVEFNASLETANTCLLRAHVAKNGVNTHVGVYHDVETANISEDVSCADFIEVDEGDALTINFVSDTGTTLTINEATFLVTKM